MKTKHGIHRQLGLSLACGLIGLPVIAAAKKPIKPPPPPPEPTLSYTLVAFEDAASWTGCRALGITDSGLVPGVFHYEMIWLDQPTPFDWPMIATISDANGDGILDLPQPLPIPAGHSYGDAIAANESGLIVGGSCRLLEPAEWPPAAPYQEGLVWQPGTEGYVPQALGVIDARLVESWAGSVNASGVVAGVCTWGNTVNWYRSFIIVPEQTTAGPSWFRDDDADGVNDLMLPIWPGPDPALDPADSSSMDPVASILGLNDDGVVVGFIDLDYAGVHPGVFVIAPDYDDVDGDGNPWFAGGAGGSNSLIQGLPPLSEGAFTVPADINSIGEVAGTSDYHAVIWRPDGNGGYSIEDLGGFAQRDHMRVSAMSDSGWLVARAYNLGTGASWPKKHPKPDLTLVWKDGVMHVLEEILTNGDGWSDLGFADVGESGVLAGYGTFNGKVTACLAVPEWTQQ